MAGTIKNEYAAYRYLTMNGIYPRNIAGKWFINNKEYAYSGKGSIRSVLVEMLPDYLGSRTKMDSFLAYIVDMHFEDGEWPEMERLAKAKEKIAAGYKPGELAYPLNEKELKIIHYLVDGDPKDSYAVFFHGIGGSGKSTVCNLIAQLFGRLDVSNCKFNSIGEKFARETLMGKRLWYDSDISVEKWSEYEASFLKKVITGDYDQQEKKGKDPYSTNYRCKALFCCNKAPKFDVSDSGLLRRILYYNKNVKFKNPIGGLDKRVYTEDELIDIICAALLTDMTDWVKDFEEETHKIIMESNNVWKYGMGDSYDTYCVACEAAGIRLPYGEEKWQLLRGLFNEWRLSFELNWTEDESAKTKIQ